MSINETNIFLSPGVHHPFLVKMSSSGCTVLKENVFRARMNGSTTKVLLPNGVLMDKNQVRPDQDSTPNGTPKKKLPTGDSETVIQWKAKREYRINKKLIRQRVYAYVMAMKRPVLHAVTISFPPCVSDDQGYQALNTWLTVCRQKLHLREYLYVAERQESGTIHFHLLVPQFINIWKANKTMSIILANFVRKGKLNWNLQAAKRYNGVDIAKNRNTKRITNFATGSAKKALTKYITKYVSKNDGGFQHYAWHNSRGFSAMMLGVSLTEAESKFLGLRPYLNMEKTFAGEYATFIPWLNQAHPFFLSALTTINRAIQNKAGPCKLFLSPSMLN